MASYSFSPIYYAENLVEKKEENLTEHFITNVGFNLVSFDQVVPKDLLTICYISKV